jgi:hypothetical protein
MNRSRDALHCWHVTVNPLLDEPLHSGLNGVVHPATAAAALALGHWVADAPGTVSQVTFPGWTTHTCVAAAQLIWMPELPHEKLPGQEPLLSVASQAAALGPLALQATRSANPAPQPEAIHRAIGERRRRGAREPVIPRAYPVPAVAGGLRMASDPRPRARPTGVFCRTPRR